MKSWGRDGLSGRDGKGVVEVVMSSRPSEARCGFALKTRALDSFGTSAAELKATAWCNGEGRETHIDVWNWRCN